MVQLALALCLAYVHAQSQATADTIVSEKQLELKFMNVGAKVYVASYGGSFPLESSEKIVLKARGTTSNVRQLNDLTGVVHIDNAAAALEYVRLRTSPATWYLWHDRQLVEVVGDAMANKLPRYGLDREGRNHAHSGFMGILSSTAFKHGGFVTAGVTITAKGFVVKRWLLGISGEKKTVELVQETVGRTGAFKREVLQSKTAPQLRDTTWYIMKFE